MFPILDIIPHLTFWKEQEREVFILHKGSERIEVFWLTFFVFWIYLLFDIFFPLSKFWRSNKKYKQRREETVICDCKDKSNHQSYKEKRSI